MKYQKVVNISFLFLIIPQLSKCDAHFQYSDGKRTILEKKYLSNRIDLELECFSNYSDSFLAKFNENIFSNGKPVQSELKTFYYETDNERNSAGSQLYVLNVSEKALSFICSTVNQKEYITNKKNENEGSFLIRAKRGTHGNSIYFSNRIYLTCFKDRQAGEIDSFKWVFSNGNFVSGQNSLDYPDDFKLGNKTGDMILINYPHNTVNVTCEAMIQGRKMNGKSYQLIPIQYPKDLALYIDEVLVTDLKLSRSEGKYNFTCKSLGGIPAPKLSFILDGRPIFSDESYVVSKEIIISMEDNGNSLICLGTLASQEKTEWTKEINVTLDVLYRPICNENDIVSEPRTGLTFTIPFGFSANPAPNHITWYYARNCDDIEWLNISEDPRYNSSKLSKVPASADKFFINLTVNGVEAADFERSIFLEVSNSQGIEKCCYAFSGKDGNQISGSAIAVIVIISLLFIVAISIALVLWKRKRNNERIVGYTAAGGDSEK